jgi:hypothetical protein
MTTRPSTSMNEDADTALILAGQVVGTLEHMPIPTLAFTIFPGILVLPLGF